MTSVCLKSNYGSPQLTWPQPAQFNQLPMQQDMPQHLPQQNHQTSAGSHHLTIMQGPLDDLKFELLAPFEQEAAVFGCHLLGGEQLSPGSDSSGLQSAYDSSAHRLQQHQQLFTQQPPAAFAAPGRDPDVDDFLFECVTPEPPLPPPLPAFKSKSEPLSPSEDPNSSAGSGAGSAAAQRRAPRPREDKICSVCGDKALGFNFDAVSCESCKAFFRRNAARGVAAFKCPYEGHCVMDVSNRRFCKRCRLRKCFDVGMKKEYILSEEEKMVKRKKIDQNKLVRSLESLQLLPKDLPAAELSERELLTEPELAEIRYALECYASSESCVLPQSAGERLGQRPAGIDDLINFAELSVLRVIDLSKRLNSFRLLSQPDKVALLKGGALELILLRGVISFDPDGARFLDAADQPEADAMDGRDFLRAAGASGHALLRLAESLRCAMRADRATLVLLLLVCLFSPDRPALSPEGRELTEAAQTRYSGLLERLLRTRLPVAEARRLFPQLLAQLAELRGLERDFAGLAGRADARLVRPLMAEFLDLQEAAAAARAGRHS